MGNHPLKTMMEVMLWGDAEHKAAKTDIKQWWVGASGALAMMVVVAVCACGVWWGQPAVSIRAGAAA